MTAIFTKRIFVALLLAIFSVSVSFASDDETREKPIILEPVVGTTAPTKPKAPSLLKISAYTDGNAVVITSTVDIMAHVTIFDSASGQTYNNNTVTIAPQYRCQIQHTDAVLTLQIFVGDSTYEGSFYL
ncbi:MAG: DUF3244 domain-containing protein [Muribaculaceae bacterium]|nr:DUF3244 domain-containing protein [Muribaculaceae bacterium]